MEPPAACLRRPKTCATNDAELAITPVFDKIAVFFVLEERMGFAGVPNMSRQRS